ncbi:hypothetical protein G6F22_012291 [Rhizopus arrhizus]|nr:hypothetical protein G6F22_012291 [Rhizopus arrhizus]
MSTMKGGRPPGSGPAKHSGFVQDQALGCHHFAEVAHAAQVVAVAQGHDALAVFLRALDGLFDDDFADVLAQAVVAVVGQHGAAVVDQFGPAVRLGQAFGQHAPVVRQDRQAVAGIAHPVGLDQVFGHVAGDVFGHALRHQHAAAVFIGLGNGEFHDAYSLEPAEPAPVRRAHHQHQQVAHDGDDDADFGELLGVEGFRAQAHHVLRRVDRQDEAVADDEAQQHCHAQAAEVARQRGQHRDQDGQHGRGQRGGAGETQVDDDQERGKDGEDGQRSQVIQPGVRYDLVAQPLARLRRQQGGAQADTHAEHDHRAPWDARLHVFPRHHAKARQHQQDQAEVGGRRGVELVQLAFSRPEQQQHDRHRHQALLRTRHGAQFKQRLFDRFLASGDAVAFRRQHLQHHDDQHGRHDQRPGGAGDQPVRPRHAFAQHLFHEADRQQVLGGGRLDADVPDAGGLRHDDHDAGGDIRALVHAESGDDTHHDGHHGGAAGGGAGHDQAQHDRHGDTSDQDAARAGADLGQGRR